MFKVKKRKARTRCEICSKLTIKTIERPRWGRSGVFIANFEHIFHLVLAFLLLTLSRHMPTWVLCLQSVCLFKDVVMYLHVVYSD